MSLNHRSGLITFWEYWEGNPETVGFKNIKEIFYFSCSENEIYFYIFVF